MGLAASQCRLMFLTARKSDLELRAQQITQRKITLTMESEKIASEYTRATNSRIIEMSWGFDSNRAGTEGGTSTLTYDVLTAENNTTLVGDMRLIAGDGSLVVNSADDKVLDKICKDPSGVTFAKVTWNGMYGVIEAIPGVNIQSADIGRRVINLQGALSDTYMFQNALRQGTLIMQKGTSQAQTDLDGNEIAGSMPPRTWKNFTWQGNESFSDNPDTTGNPKALGIYETKMARVQRLDKIMDMELKQVETQQKAAEAEVDSVKKIIQGNIEKSFKTFA